ncbi:MAG: hypothetical protein JSR59_21520 [Proteobacteria bacterium]|nr:hypothetical protein [Pseudomonadota bacterium]
MVESLTPDAVRAQVGVKSGDVRTKKDHRVLDVLSVAVPMAGIAAAFAIDDALQAKGVGQVLRATIYLGCFGAAAYATAEIDRKRGSLDRAVTPGR